MDTARPPQFNLQKLFLAITFIAVFFGLARSMFGLLAMLVIVLTGVWLAMSKRGSRADSPGLTVVRSLFILALILLASVGAFVVFCFVALSFH